MREIRSELTRITGESGIVTDPVQLDSLLTDERRLFTGSAAAVVQPASVSELSTVVAYCAEHQIAMVPQGGNTGYCGGATPDSSGEQVVINLSRMKCLRSIDSIGQTITVEAGMILQDVQAHAAAADLLFPLSMGSEGSCQIGGNVSTNAGGLAVLRYGTAKELVLGLEVVLPNGELLQDLQGLRKDNTGYDLKQLFLGAEGTLGIISAVQLKLFPRPPARATAWVVLPEIASAYQLLRFVQSNLGECITSFEYISGISLTYVLEHIDGVAAPLPSANEHMALVEVCNFDSPDTLEDKFVAVLGVASERGLAIDAVIAQSEAQRSQLWRLRESIPRAEKLMGGSVKHDVSVALPQIDTLVAAASKAVAQILPAARLSIYGHVGDGNVHFNVLHPVGDDPAAFKQEFGAAISAAVHGAALELNGSFSAEHGVGQLKKNELLKAKPPAAIALMRTIKRALDPQGLMNPGKVIG